MQKINVNGVSLSVNVIGQGDPLVLMHGGPGVDQTTMLPFKSLADQFTLIFYDHRCNGRSTGAEVSTMTWENLTADADALRETLGFERWAVLGHSFGGMVALEYALRYPHSLSHLILVDTCGDSQWVHENAPNTLARRGFNARTVALARRFFNGQIEPKEMNQAMQKFGSAYYHHPTLWLMAREIGVGLRMKTRPEALIYGFSHLLSNWNVMHRLGEIAVPTLVMGGRHDFQFPPEHQTSLAAGIQDAHLRIIEDAGHNAHSERTNAVVEAIRQFFATAGSG